MEREEKLMVMLKDIAEACGVSRATVSKVMNGYGDISRDTKEAVRAKAEELGYLPNLAARTLKTNRTYSLGILLTDALGSGFKHEYFINILNSFKSEAEKNGYNISFLSDVQSRKDLTYLEQCCYRSLDGVLIACTDYENEQVLALLKSDLPTVTTDYLFSGCSAVLSDNAGGMQMLMEYILNQGHRRIAFIHGEMTEVTKQRLAVFYKTCEAYGVAPSEELVIEARYRDAQLCAQLTEQLAGMDERPTCILYPDDFALTGGLNSLLEMNLRIPDDISIAGYDGSFLSGILKFTTVYQDTESIGKYAAQLLISEIEHPKTWLPVRKTVPSRLISGESVKAVQR